MRVPLPFKPADRYVVFTPSIRMAESILRIDHEIEPRMPIIRILSSTQSLRGYRELPVLTLDPRFELREQERYTLSLLSSTGHIRGWTRLDFAYLKELTRRGPDRATS